MAAVRHLEFSKFRVYVCHVISMAMLFFFLLPRAKFEMDGWMDGWMDSTEIGQSAAEL